MHDSASHSQDDLPVPRVGVAAWQPDPTGRHERRWWDGDRRRGGRGWTTHVCDGRDVGHDPL